MGSVTYDFAGETVIVTGGSSGVGRAVLFLASDTAGDVTGELFYVDGGWQVY